MAKVTVLGYVRDVTVLAQRIVECHHSVTLQNVKVVSVDSLMHQRVRHVACFLYVILLSVDATALVYVLLLKSIRLATAALLMLPVAMVSVHRNKIVIQTANVF
jgi:hypothetical protein